MALLTAQISVPTGSAVELTDGAPIGSGAAAARPTYSICLENTDATNPVYLGKDNTVTSASGYKLAAGGVLALDLAYGEQIFARATGGAVSVHVIQSKF